MFANEKLPDQHYGFKTLLIDYFNHNNEKQSFCSTVCISMRICLLQHLTHTDFHWGHTYPSCGMRTRALGRSSIEELTMVSRKSPSGWATWFKKKKKRKQKAPHCQVSCSAPIYGHVSLWPPPLQTDLENLPHFQSKWVVPSFDSCDNSHRVWPRSKHCLCPYSQNMVMICTKSSNVFTYFTCLHYPMPQSPMAQHYPQNKFSMSQSCN